MASPNGCTLGQSREAVLVAWGIGANGAKVLLSLAPGTKEDLACAREFLRDLKARGMNEPVLVVSDGAPGLIRAIKEVFAQSVRQCSLAHKLRNLEGKVPEQRARSQSDTACYHAPSPMVARLLKEEYVKRYERELPSATACLLDDFEACIAHLRLPITHRQAWHSGDRLCQTPKGRGVAR